MANRESKMSGTARLNKRYSPYSQHIRHQAQPILPRMPANFSLTCCTSSGLARATMGKSLSRSNGRQASMMARELVELALSSNRSSGPLQARRTKSMSLAGSPACADRPHHVEQVGRIDILVDHGDEASEIGRRLAAGGEHHGPGDFVSSEQRHDLADEPLERSASYGAGCSEITVRNPSST